MDIQEAPLTVTPIEDGFRIAFTGPIHTNVSWIESEMAKVVAAKPKVIEVDLGKTSYVSSFGLGVLVALRNNVTENGGVFKIVAIDSRAFSVVRYANLAKVLNIEPAAVVHAKA